MKVKNNVNKKPFGRQQELAEITLVKLASVKLSFLQGHPQKQDHSLSPKREKIKLLAE